MGRELSQTILLRVAAFVVDALSLAILLILPAALISYAIVWFGGNSMRAITLTWNGAFFLLVLGILLRDGHRGRSFGKRILGLTLLTRNRKPCSWRRSAIRNLPLVVPGWNLLELYLVIFSSKSMRTGDRISGTQVIEE